MEWLHPMWLCSVRSVQRSYAIMSFADTERNVCVMDYQQLECVIEVCKYNSFTRAANALFLSQSSVSKNIAALEQELGISLVERTRHKVAPTEAGLYLAREAQKIVRQMSEAAEQAKHIASGKLGFLKLGVSEELDINGLLPGFISGFSRKYSEIEIAISVHSYKELANLILLGELDVAFGPCQSAVGLSTSDLYVFPINRAAPRLYYSKEHRYAGRKELKATDFLDDSYIAMRNRFSKTLPALNALGLNFHKVIYVDSLQAMKLYIEANQGVAVLGESYTIINSSKVRYVMVEGMRPVGTDLLCKQMPANKSTVLFVRELETYIARRKPRMEE